MPIYLLLCFLFLRIHSNKSITTSHLYGFSPVCFSFMLLQICKSYCGITTYLIYIVSPRCVFFYASSDLEIPLYYKYKHHQSMPITSVCRSWPMQSLRVPYMWWYNYWKWPMCHKNNWHTLHHISLQCVFFYASSDFISHFAKTTFITLLRFLSCVFSFMPR